MKNYYDTKHELELIKLRLEVLRENKESLESLVDPKSAVTDKIFIDPEKISTDENIAKYIYLLSQIKDEIEEKTIEAGKLEQKLKVMEKYLREIKDVKYKVFVMYYIENLSVGTIERRLHYGKSQIYEMLKKIRNELRIRSAEKSGKVT